MKRTILISLSVALAAVVAGLVWFFIEDSFVFVFFLGTLLVLTMPFAGAFLLLGRWGRNRRRAGKRGGSALLIVAVVGIALVACLALWFVWSALPTQEGIVARGVSPDGREYGVSQAWNDWFDDYDIRLFVRGENGDWIVWYGGRDWHPGDPFKIRFSEKDGSPVLEGPYERLFQNSEPAHDARTYPGNLSLEELHAIHRREKAEDRRR